MNFPEQDGFVGVLHEAELIVRNYDRFKPVEVHIPREAAFGIYRAIVLISRNMMYAHLNQPITDEGGVRRYRASETASRFHSAYSESELNGSLPSRLVTTGEEVAFIGNAFLDAARTNERYPFLLRRYGVNFPSAYLALEQALIDGGGATDPAPGQICSYLLGVQE